MEQILEGLNIVLLGKTGAGKSLSGNTILGRQAFKSKKSSKSVTQSLAVKSGKVGQIPVNVYDTPGLFDTDMNENEIQQKLQTLLQECESGPCVYLLVIKTERFTKEERETVEKIEKLLGKERLEKTWILFTRGDELEDENMTIEEFINDTEPLKKLVEKYDRRYHVFNNKRKENTGQVQKLFTKILNSYLHVPSDGEVLETLKQNPLMRKIPQDTPQDTPVSNLSSTRIVLLGKSGVGKSAAGNTILGQKEFISLTRMNSVTSESSDKQTSVLDRSVSVVDTPGLFDTNMTQEDLMTEIMRSVYLSSPGPHAFLIVLPVNNRFTEQEQKIPHMIEMIFGEEVLKYSIILFTHGDQLKIQNIEKLIQESSKLRHLVNQCGGRYHVFNNRDHNNREQVNVLLQKIDKMIEKNGGKHYSNEMFEDALRFRQEEEEQRQREEEEIKQQEEKQRLDEEKRREEEIDRVRKETEEKTRAECEAKMNSELKTFREEKQKQEEIERVRKKKTRAENEAKRKSELELAKLVTEKPNNRFIQFLSKYWKHILIVLVVGGVFSGVGVGIGVGIGVCVGTGFAVGIGTGIASSCIAAGAACAYEKYKQ